MAIFRDTTGKNHSDRNAGDRQRHHQIIRKTVQGDIADILADESIIGKDKGKIIKVKIRAKKEYRFIYGENNPGVGQGDGEVGPGDIVGQKQQEGEGDQKAGDQPGIDYYESDIVLEDLLDMMFEDLELPLLERKQLREMEVETTVRRKGTRRKGPRNKLRPLATAKQHIRTIKGHALALKQIAEEIAKLRSANKNSEADSLEKKLEEHKREIEALKEKLNAAKGEGWVPIREDDKRYYRSEIKPKKQSNAVVICMMDTSGSMDTTKKYLARSFFFFLYHFIVRRYQNVEIVFVAHHTEAKEVTEEEFFSKGESGGTYISSAYVKALEIIKERYDVSLWNVYAFHCSDGDNSGSDNEKAVSKAKELCEKSNLFGYVEIKPGSSTPGHYGYAESSMIKVFAKLKQTNFHSAIITQKGDVYPAFKKFMEKDRVKEEV